MSEETRRYPLLTTLMTYTRLPWYWTTIIVTVLSLLLLLLAALLDGKLSDVPGWNFWRISIDGIVTVIYILAIYPFMARLRERAIQTFRPLLSLENDVFDKVTTGISRPNRRWEWAAVFLGIAITGSLGQPWKMDWIS
ncbi:MAG: hypothetical protein JSV77_04295 [Dehalococcoidales bacterium]|nr:MAG: hypothetical protein JSV77_04295 [Dehalococcoidales bacterium]